MRGVKKAHLPEKPCLHCGLPFTWRKKWERVWDEVKYCSERCRRQRTGAATAATPTNPTNPTNPVTKKNDSEMKALYWFRQDLRLNDNLALRLACDKADELLAVVLADHQRTQTTPWGFARKGPHRIAFETQALNGLIQSLEQRGVELYQVQSEVHEPTQSDAVQALITVAKRYGLSTVFL